MTVRGNQLAAISIEQTDLRAEESVEQRDTQGISLDSLYREHRAALLQHLQVRVKNNEVAEELLHDTFVRVSKMPVLGIIRQPRPFLLKVASNLALDYLRKCQRAPDTDPDIIPDEVMSPGPSQAELITQERRINQLYKAIESLPPRAREALLLARMKEMTNKEVAQQLGVSQTMVEKHLRNALQKCRAALTSDLH